MQFERTDSETHPYRIIFEGDEVKVIQAVFLEELNSHLSSGNVGSVSDYDYRMAEAGDDPELLPTKVRNAQEIIDRLEQFNENTEDAIMKIAQFSSEPSFRNTDTLLRHELGERALELAMELTELAQEQMQFDELDITNLDMDAELSNLLDQESRSDQDDPRPPRRWG